MTARLQPPRHPHGQRLLISQIDIIAAKQPDKPWLVTPVNNSDLTQGFDTIPFRKFANAVNHVAKWLRENLSLPVGGFPAFAYRGPTDYSYALFAAAAGKLSYQMLLFGPTITAEGQQRILEAKNCTTYVYTQDYLSVAKSVQSLQPHLRAVRSPELNYFMTDDVAQPVEYTKTFVQARHDPWLVFHTSGTTGYPKPITYTQLMMSTVDIVLGLDDMGDNHLKHHAGNRIYLPMQPMHYASMFMTLGLAIWGTGTPIFGPSGKLPSPHLVTQILENTQVDGAVLVPALIDALCRDTESLRLLRKLKYIHYAGAPLSPSSGKLLSPYVRLAPAIGSTDAGTYSTILPNTTEDWNYVSFNPYVGAVMEHRLDGLHELVFVRDPQCYMQLMFETRPDIDRFETKDLWLEHPSKNGQWKIVGRLDDFVKLANGNGMLVTPLEAILMEHPQVRNALIGGHGRPKPVVLIDLVETTAALVDSSDEEKEVFIESLKPHLDRVNSRCYRSTHLDPRLVVFATADKPWPRTLKDTPVRPKTFELYQPETDEQYKRFVSDA